MNQIVGFIIPLIIMFALMYFMIIRPQQKQMKKAQDMYDQLSPGDVVVTVGGLHGVIDEVNRSADTIVLDCEGVYLTFELRAVSRVVEESSQAAAETYETSSEDVPEEE